MSMKNFSRYLTVPEKPGMIVYPARIRRVQPSSASGECFAVPFPARSQCCMSIPSFHSEPQNIISCRACSNNITWNLEHNLKARKVGDTVRSPEGFLVDPENPAPRPSFRLFAGLAHPPRRGWTRHPRLDQDRYLAQQTPGRCWTCLPT